jgi:hypothetical protein
MTDWRQIQARIRKAKASADPAASLTKLFDKTRDAMVAFELGRLDEQAGRNEGALRWYTTAAERFRRAEWKTRAQEALTRLGGPVPAPASVTTEPVEFAAAAASLTGSRGLVEEPPASHQMLESSSQPGAAAGIEAQTSPAAPARRRRRRGRRGGRRHRRGREQPAVAPQPPPPVPAAEPAVAREPAVELPRPVAAPVPSESERVAASLSWQGHARAGEPALASRLAQLEMLLRRLLAGSLHRLGEAEEAPAGPGVYLLSDSDLTTVYFVDAVKTLRVALGHLAQAGRSQRGGHRESALRSRLAEHLEISESRLAKYLKEHCVVRWLQLDEDASHLAHFAIAVLRPPLNLEE